MIKIFDYFAKFLESSGAYNPYTSIGENEDSNFELNVEHACSSKQTFKNSNTCPKL